MSIENETTEESLIEQVLEEPEEEIHDSDKLEEEKRKISFDENNARDQVFIQGDVQWDRLIINNYYSGMKPVASEHPREKTYDLRILKECVEFVEEYKNSQYLSMAVLLCVFEVVALTDLPDLKFELDILLRLKNGIEDKENIKVDSFISLDSMLTVIGARKYATEAGKQYVSMGKDAVVSLINLFEQFPIMYSVYEDFLIWIASNGKYSVPFYISQLALALAKIYVAGVMDFSNRIFPELCKSVNNVFLIGEFIYHMYIEDAREADRIIGYLIQAKNEYVWRMLSVTYIYCREDGMTVSFEKEMKAILCRRIVLHKKMDMYFISNLLMKSKYFRNVICEVFDKAYKRACTREKQRELGQSYVYLVRFCYYKVDSTTLELPLVACDTSLQQEYLQGLLSTVMREYNLRKQLYALLKAYLKELSQYNFSRSTILHLAGFCYNTISSDLQYEEDIKEMLLQCNCKTAKLIVCNLYKTKELKETIYE